MEIRVNLNPLEATTAFPYLGRTIRYNNSDWVALYSRSWGLVAKVLGKIGSPIKAQAMIYKALVQAVLLYGSEIWVVTHAMITVIEGFHHRISRCIAVIKSRKCNGG